MSVKQKGNTGKKNITLKVDSDIAGLYEKASQEKLEKIEFILSFLLYGNDYNPLLNDDLTWNEKGLDKICDQAYKNGMTEEILDSILKEK